MAQKNPARGSATRTANMNRRREHILACAGTMIARDGYDAFTLGQLAEEANVTVPTIHNLIGKKSKIFERLVDDMVAQIEAVLQETGAEDPIAAVEAFTDSLMALFAANEDLYKAAFIAGERSGLFEHEMPTGIYAKSLSLAYQVCENARAAGYLKGGIDADLLAQHLFASQRLARQDWMNGYIDLDAYRQQVLKGMFITLAADANPEFHDRLMKKIRE